MYSLDHLITFALGLSYSIFVGHWLVKANVDALWELTGVGEASVRLQEWPSTFLGALERALYTISLLMGRGEFIAVWLALKAIPQWQRWNEAITIDAAQSGKKRMAGLAIYNNFLIGNGLNILFAVVGWRIASSFTFENFIFSIIVSVVLIIICLVSLSRTKYLAPRKIP